VITGYGAFVDYTKLGYSSYKLYLKLNATINQKKELRSFLEKQKHVFSIFESHGNWDMAIAIFAKNREDYYNLENKLMYKFGKIISSKKFCLMIDAIMLNNNIILDDNKLEEYPIWKYDSIEKIDDKDKIIIHELHKNAKENLVNLSYKVKMSIDSVSKRLKKLNEKKIIPFYNTNINYNLLGYEKYKLFIYVKKYSNEFEDKLIEYLKNKKNTINLIRMIGPWKIEVELLIKEYNDFQEILSEMQEKYAEYILKFEYSIFRNEVWFPSENLLL